MNPPPDPADHTQYVTSRNPQDYLPKWREFYETALDEREPMRRAFTHDLAVAYGPDPRHVINVYRPRSEGLSPAIVFFHGGRWREGHPNFYDYLGRPWVEDGAVFVSCGYRLEPEASIVDAINDVSRSIAWVASNAETYGIDPRRLTVAGHSAGAHMAVMACLTDWNEVDFPAGGTVRNVWSMSGPMDLSTMGVGEAGELDPTQRLRTSSAQVLVSFGEPEDNRRGADPNLFAQEGRRLASALARLEVPVRKVSVADMDHIASAALIAERDSPFHRLAVESVFGSTHDTPSPR